MALTLTYLTLRQVRSKAKFVIFNRIDQKTCLKAIITANLKPIVIEPVLSADALVSNIDEIIKTLKAFDRDEILCVCSTTSCFAPRAYDNVIEISRICRQYGIPHIVNNAYGIYCNRIIDDLNKAVKTGRIDAIVSSTDKNLMVPVGGSFIYSNFSSKPMKSKSSTREQISIEEDPVDLVELTRKNYPGRGSITPILDVFITLLEMGLSKYKALMKERSAVYKRLLEDMEGVAKEYGERLLRVRDNKISMAMTLTSVCRFSKDKADTTFLGGMFFNRQISGIKVISSSYGKAVNLQGHEFKNYGSHSDCYPSLPYVVFAAAIGITQEEAERFKSRFKQCLNDFIKSTRTRQLEAPLTVTQPSKPPQLGQPESQASFLIAKAFIAKVLKDV